MVGMEISQEHWRQVAAPMLDTNSRTVCGERNLTKSQSVHLFRDRMDPKGTKEVLVYRADLENQD